MADERGHKKITRITPLEAHLVEYWDHDGKKQIRVTMTAPAVNTSYIVKDRVGGGTVVTPSTKWFNDQLYSALEKANESMESV